MKAVTKLNALFLNYTAKAAVVFIVAGFLTCLDSGFSQIDSIVQITAEVQGLEQVTPDEWMPLATYWEAMPGSAAFAPLPCPPSDTTLPVYAIADGQYLVDGSNGQLPRGDTVSAMETVSNAVVNLINQIQGIQIAQSMRAMGMDLPGPPGFGDGGDGDAASFTNYYFFSINTNLLWLQITNASLETAYVNLYHATDQVYAIWSTTNLAIPLSLWQVETEVFPTNSTTNRLAFTVPTLGRQDLFLQAQDWTGVYSNGLPCWWTWYYFHTLDLTSTNMDSQNENALGYDYTYGIDPNVISFMIGVTNTYVTSSSANVPVTVLSGLPAYQAVLVGDTNLADAVWLPYNDSNVVVTFGADGNYTVSIGLRGFPGNATETWQVVTFTKNTVAPLLTRTSPAGSTISQTPVQVQGFAKMPLSSLTFDLTNASGVFTNQPGYLTGQIYDSNLKQYTTNYFESGDVDLAGGPNAITLHATDWEGNETNVSFTLNYSPGTNPPALNIIWPPPGTTISASNFTVQAQVDQPAATISATAGATTIQGLVEGNGAAWVQNLPLTPGTNSITVTVNDSNGSTTTNFNVVDNDVGLVVDPLTEDQLNQPSVNVYGEIGNASLSVYVNGVKATVHDDGTWEADGVSVSPSGTAIFSVQVYSGDPVLVASQILYQIQPVMVAMMSYSGHQTFVPVYYPGSATYSETINWTYDNGGNWQDNSGDPDDDSFDFTPATNGVAYIANYVSFTGDPFPFGMPWEFASFSAPGGDYDPMESDTQTRVMIEPGGQEQAGTTNLYLVFASAGEFSNYGEVTDYKQLFENYGALNYWGDVPLPPEWLQIRGQTLLNSGITNSNGSVWGLTLVSAPAGKNWDVTPEATQVYQNWDYTFDTQATNLTLRLKGTYHGYDFTGQTNPVIVGEQVALVAQLSVTNQFMTNWPLSNFQWTIPGYAISNFVANGNSGIVYSNFPTTSSNVFFSWVDGGSNRVVQCSATVNGQTVTGSTTFNVVKPAVTVTSQTGTIAIDTNYTKLNVDGSIQISNVFALHYGNSVGIPGIAFNASPLSFSYFTNLVYSFEWVQLMNYGTNQAQATDGTWFTTLQVSNNMLDSVYPYIGNTTNTSDSPALIIVHPSNYQAGSVSQSFSMWLMFKPAQIDAITLTNTCYVPLRVVNWGWNATASISGVNWILTSSNNIVNPTGMNSTIYPQWTDNATNHLYPLP